MLNQALAADIQRNLKDARRFIPFVVMHEFEALLFSDCAKFAAGIERTDLCAEISGDSRRLRNRPRILTIQSFTHPAQRVVNLVPEYQKPLFGNIAALEIGFETMRLECSHFRDWIERLENLTH